MSLGDQDMAERAMSCIREQSALAPGERTIRDEFAYDYGGADGALEPRSRRRGDTRVVGVGGAREVEATP